MADSAEPKPHQISRRQFLKKSGLAVTAILANSACNKIPVVKETPPALQITPVTVKESPQIPTIGIMGVLESTPGDPSLEKIKFVFPQEVLNGNSPLVPSGDLLSFYFELAGDLPVKKLKINIKDLLDMDVGKLALSIDTLKPSAPVVIGKTVDNMLEIAKSNGKFLQIDEESKKVIDKMEIICGKIPQTDRLAIRIFLPNETFTYTDSRGAHTVNSAERLASGVFKFGIQRWENLPKGTVTGPVLLTASNIQIDNSTKGQLAAKAYDIKLAP